MKPALGRGLARDRRGTNPVRSFAILSVLPLVVLGLVLSATVQGVMRERYLRTYAASADLALNSMASLVVASPTLQQSFATSGP